MANKMFVLVLALSFTQFASAGLCGDALKSSTATAFFEQISGEGADKKLTTGIEVEAALPESLGMAGLANLAYGYLRGLGLLVERKYFLQPVSSSYRTRVFSLTWTSNGHEYDLKITQDFSVRPESGYSAVEVVSPILRDSEDAEVFIGMMEAFKQAGLKEEPNHSGVHIHVGVEDVAAAELSLIAWGFHLFDEKLRQATSFSEYRTKYVGRQSEGEINDLKWQSLSTRSVQDYLEKHYSGKKDRYVGVNLASLKKFGTVEIRLFNSSVDPRVLRFSRHMARKLIGGVRSKDPGLLAVLRKAETEEVEIEELFEVIGLDMEKTQEVLEIFQIEHQQNFVSHWKLRARTWGLIPKHIYMGWVRGVLLPYEVPKGWEDITE